MPSVTFDKPCMHIINPPISHLGLIYFLKFLHGDLFTRRDQRFFLVVCQNPVEIFLLANYFFDATHTSNRIFFKGLANFCKLIDAVSFLAPYSTNRLSNRYGQVFG